MSLKERIYSVLIVSASENLNKNLRDMLPCSKYDPVKPVSNVSAAKRELADRDFDFLIINSPLPDDDGVRFSIDAVEHKNTVVLLLVRSEIYAETFEALAESGVFVIPKPVSRTSMNLALDWLISARERMRKSEKKVMSVEEKMAEIRLVNRAKWMLISELKMTEPDAHRYIEKQAMDRCVAKGKIAQEIIKTYE